MRSHSEFSVQNGVLDVSLWAFPEPPEDLKPIIFENLVAAFAQADYFWYPYEPDGGPQFRIKRLALTLPPKLLACLRAEVLKDRIGLNAKYRKHKNGSVELGLFQRFAKVLNGDGMSDVRMRDDFSSGWERPQGELVTYITGNVEERWHKVIEQFAALKEQKHPMAEWIFSPPPSRGGGGWATSR